MTTDHDLDAQLRLASGIREADVPPLPRAFRDQLKRAQEQPASVIAAQQLLAEAPRPGVRQTSRARVRRHRRPIAGVAALTTLAAAAAVVALQPHAATPEQVTAESPGAEQTVLSLAGYSPIPELPDDLRAVRIAAACAAATAGSASALNPAFDSDYADGVLTEVRDQFGLDVFAGQQYRGLCLTQTDPVGSELVVAVAVDPTTAQPQGQDFTADLSTTADLALNTGVQRYQAAAGRVATTITSVDVTLANGEVITATVSNGWWAAWWPALDNTTATATATGSDGTILQVPLD